MSDERARVLAALKRWGTHPTSFQILEPGNSYWFDPDSGDPGALVAYQTCGRYRVAAGVPVAPPEALGSVAARFIADGATQGLRTLFFSADDRLIAALGALEDAPPLDAVVIGEQPEWDPALYTTDGPTRASLRAQLRRAANKGVRVRAISEEELTHAPGPVRAEIENVLQQWLASRRMSAMAFLVDLEPFEHPSERRYYVAEHEGRAVGFLSAIPVYHLDGWFFEDVLRIPTAPNGTVELLIDTAMVDARTRGERFVTLGLAPLAGIDEGPGPHRIMRRVLRGCYEHLGALYSFEGVRQFKARFQPDEWRPQYLLSSPAPLGIGAFHAVLRAFAGGGLVAFGVDTLRRLGTQITPKAWSWALLTLALLLVPWTANLAAVDGERWFGDASIQAAWVSFDVLMIAALCILATLVRWRPGLARPVALSLAGATGADFVLTSVQAFNLHQDVAGVAVLFVAAGALGPLLATALLVFLATTLPQQRR